MKQINEKVSVAKKVHFFESCKVFASMKFLVQRAAIVQNSSRLNVVVRSLTLFGVG